MSMFVKAVKQSAKLRMAITGPSGSGKTYTALAIATGLAAGKPIAVVDTEHGSAAKYADPFSFDVAEMHAPFHPDKFIAALREAEQAGYGVVILDSLSHAWAGTGGVLDIVDEAAKRSKSGNTYMAWKEGTPVQQRLIDAILQSNIHVIATMRSKTEYILETDRNGKQAPRKVGMAPIQRNESEYEFDVVLDMDVDNNAIVSKTRCPALTGRVFPKPGADVSSILREWLDGAPAPVQQPQPAPTPQPARNGAAKPQPAAQAQAEPEPETPANDNPFEPHIIAADKLTGNCAKFADWARTKHAQSNGPATRPMYEYLSGVIDAICGNDIHKDVLAVLVGRSVNSDNPPGFDLASALLDWLPETTGKGDAKTANPNHNAKYAECIRNIGTLVMEARGQATLGI